MGQPQSAHRSGDPNAERPINLFIPPYAVPVVLPHSKRHCIKEETTATLTELRGSDDGGENEAVRPESPSTRAFLAKPSDWILMDIESLKIIRSVYAAEMVVGGGNYLVVSAKGLAMKEVNPSQIGSAMMTAWKRIREEIVEAILPLGASFPKVGSDEYGSADGPGTPDMKFDDFGTLASAGGADQNTAFPTPDTSDQGSERDLMS
ncbi:MAG: hypothetical protein M1839_004130 [Geoglossum umbratile]|nr:MAG: hypothetical protein M1839_004130 [Geoglossum umbratile]